MGREGGQETTASVSLMHPLAHPYVLSWVLGLGSNPISAGAQGTHLSGFTALSFFFGLKSKREKDKKVVDQEIQASCLSSSRPQASLWLHA